MPDLTSLKLSDYSDRELLLIVADAADDEGYASTDEIVRRVGVTGERARQCVGGRLAWLKRYGAVERNSETGKDWRLTAIGEVLARGELRKRDRAALESLGPEHLLLATRMLTSRVRTSPDTAKHLLRREWRRGAVLNLNGNQS